MRPDCELLSIEKRCDGDLSLKSMLSVALKMRGSHMFSSSACLKMLARRGWICCVCLPSLVLLNLKMFSFEFSLISSHNYIWLVIFSICSVMCIVKLTMVPLCIFVEHTFRLPSLIVTKCLLMKRPKPSLISQRSVFSLRLQETWARSSFLKPLPVSNTWT